ncbi:hypothetical protein R3P38DRAFT_2812195 [Favolaschia claudopus]|uniref:Uncharacterized protein n=1 Tax=Favolaschia claudopus TaxID=2862362 RepID=A0AAV9Z8Q1_9AGAR
MATTIISRKAQRKQATNSAPAPSPETIGTIAPIGSAVTDDGDPPSSRGRRRTKAVPTPDDVGDSHANPGHLLSTLMSLIHLPSLLGNYAQHLDSLPRVFIASGSGVTVEYIIQKGSAPDGAVDTAKLYTSAWQHVDHNEAREGSLIQERKFPMLTTPRKRRLTGKLSRTREKLVSDIPRRRRHSPSPVRDALPVNNDAALAMTPLCRMVSERCARSEKDRAVDSSPHKGGHGVHGRGSSSPEQFVLGMNKLRDLRVNDDRESAEQVAVNDAVEEADFEYAKQVQAQDQEEFSRRVLEIQRETAEEDEKARVLEEDRTYGVRSCVRMDFTPLKADAAAPKPKVEDNSLYGVGKPVPWHDRVVFPTPSTTMLKGERVLGAQHPFKHRTGSGWDLNATPPAKKIRAEGQAEAMGEGKSTTPVNPQAKKEKKAKKKPNPVGWGRVIFRL